MSSLKGGSVEELYFAQILGEVKTLRNELDQLKISTAGLVDEVLGDFDRKFRTSVSFFSDEAESLNKKQREHLQNSANIGEEIATNHVALINASSEHLDNKLKEARGLIIGYAAEAKEKLQVDMTLAFADFARKNNEIASKEIMAALKLDVKSLEESISNARKQTNEAERKMRTIISDYKAAVGKYGILLTTAKWFICAFFAFSFAFVSAAVLALMYTPAEIYGAVVAFTQAFRGE